MSFFTTESISSYVQDKLSQLVDVKRHRKYIAFRCPVCGDSHNKRSKRRGTYYIATDSYFCFNGGCKYNDHKGKGFNLLADVQGISIEEVKKDYLNSIKSVEQFRQATTQIEKKQETVKETKPKFTLPSYWNTLSKDSELYKKIIEPRRIMEAPYALANWKFYYNTKSQRLVIPWTCDGEIKYYQERKIYKYQEPKYKFPCDTNKIIYGLDKLDSNYPYLFFTEGILDCVFLHNGVAVGGLYPTEQQMIQLNEMPHKVVWFPDNPWIDDSAAKKIMSVVQTNPKQLIFTWDKKCIYKDINELVVAENDVNYFENIQHLEDHIVTLDKMKVMLILNKRVASASNNP